MNHKEWRYLERFTGVYIVLVIIFFANDLRIWGTVTAVLGMMMLTAFTVYKCKKGPCRRKPNQRPVPTISSSVDHATRPPRPRRTLTPREATTNYHLTEGPVTLTSLFDESSPTNASQTSDTSSTGYIHAPSAPVLPGYSGRTDMEAATIVAANRPPPAYPEVVGDYPGLPPRSYLTPVTGEGLGNMSEPLNDGLPSYEAAMSTRQPPAYEAPRTPPDDGPTIND